MKQASLAVGAIVVGSVLVGCSADPNGDPLVTAGRRAPSSESATGGPAVAENVEGSDEAVEPGFALPGAAAPAAQPVGCNGLEFGISDFGPFAPDSALPYRGDVDAEVNVFRSGYLNTTLDYGALRRYADPRYCSPAEVNCLPSSNQNRFRTLRVRAGLGAARAIRFALWQTPKNQVAWRQVSMNTPGASAGARDVPVGTQGTYTFELKNIVLPAMLTGIALDDRSHYMLTAYVPDASQRDVYRNSVCALRMNVTGKGFAN